MPLYSFTITSGQDDPERIDLELPDLQSAWAQAVTVCGESLEDMDGHFGLSDEWNITVSDENDKALFRLRCNSEHFLVN
jgi:hypothetical protein